MWVGMVSWHRGHRWRATRCSPQRPNSLTALAPHAPAPSDRSAQHSVTAAASVLIGDGHAVVSQKRVTDRGSRGRGGVAAAPELSPVRSVEADSIRVGRTLGGPAAGVLAIADELPLGNGVAITDRRAFHGRDRRCSREWSNRSRDGRSGRSRGCGQCRGHRRRG